MVDNVRFWFEGVTRWYTRLSKQTISTSKHAWRIVHTIVSLYTPSENIAYSGGMKNPVRSWERDGGLGSHQVRV